MDEGDEIAKQDRTEPGDDPDHYRKHEQAAGRVLARPHASRFAAAQQRTQTLGGFGFKGPIRQFAAGGRVMTDSSLHEKS